VGEETEIKKPKKSRWKPLPYVDQSGSYAILSVINYDRQEGVCPICGNRRVLFNAMDCRGRDLGGQIVIRQCKSCLENYAAEREITVSVKTTLNTLRGTWDRNNLPVPSPGRKKAGVDRQTKKRLEEPGNTL